MSNRSYPLAAALGAALLAALTPALAAGTTYGSFIVSATVDLACSVESTTNISFGTIQSPVQANLNSSGSVTTRCTDGATWNIALSVGNGSGATFARRKMTSSLNAANTLEYGLYRDSTRNEVWGDGTGGSVLACDVKCDAASVPVTTTVYARIFGGQSPAAGSYSDTIVVTLMF